MLNAIGIRQGRLLPASAPTSEFEIARGCGFRFIEWLCPAADLERNPIWTEHGQTEIRERMAATGIEVVSLCADYFMTYSLIRISAAEQRQRADVLTTLIERLAAVGGSILVVPILEGAAIRQREEFIEVREALDGPIQVAAAHHVTLALETDLPAAEVVELVGRSPHRSLGVCYDTGNSAAQGCNVAQDIQTLAPYLTLVHIKDRRRNGISVPLGQGAADFKAFFGAARSAGYAGPLVLETPPGNIPADLAFLREQSASSSERECVDR